MGYGPTSRSTLVLKGYLGGTNNENEQRGRERMQNKEQTLKNSV